MLTQEQINYFHTNGYLIMKGLIKGKELELLQQAADAVQAEGIAREGSQHVYYKNKEQSYHTFISLGYFICSIHR